MALKKLALTCALVGALAGQGRAEIALTPEQIEPLAQKALIYAYPMVMAYGVLDAFSLNRNSGQYKAPLNQIFNEARVFTPADTAVVTPNSDTPYSFAVLDLRAEPMVLCVPEVEAGRYYSIQLTSLYTYNFAYIGSRATGNGAGCYAVAGPDWTGDKPEGIAEVFQSETQFVFGIYRTQLFNAADMPNVQKIQAKYVVEPLSAFLKQPAPPAAPAIDWPPVNSADVQKNPLNYLNFLLQFGPAVGTAAVELPLRAKFAELGIEPGKPFPLDSYTPDQEKALLEAGKSASLLIEDHAGEGGRMENGWSVVVNAFGSRADLKDDYLMRAAAAKAGIFGNDAVEALYPMTRVDSEGQPLDGSNHRYTITFPKDGLPPVKAFWSVTMYDGKTQLLVRNPIDRYLINSPMLPELKPNADGSLTLYIQKDAPVDPDQKANWLPAPDGPIYLVMRLYWPEEAALKGDWQPPKVVRVD